MVVSRAASALGPVMTNSTSPVAALNKKSPASKRQRRRGRQPRRADAGDRTGVARMLTSTQATNAPVTVPPPTTEISARRAACASMPRAIGNAGRRHGIEKESAKGGGGASCRNHVDDQRHGRTSLLWAGGISLGLTVLAIAQMGVYDGTGQHEQCHGTGVWCLDRGSGCRRIACDHDRFERRS